MHLSTSNSEREIQLAATPTSGRLIRFAIVVLIASFAAVFLSAEILSRYAFPHISHIEARVRSDEREARSIRAPVPGSVPVILIVGNSLLLRGLDYPKIQQLMAPGAQVRRFVIENTDYLDWYYGLQQMFKSGVRPSTVVVCLNLGQTVSSKTLGDYSAYHLFGVSELLPLARAARMDATRTSGLFLAHWSTFYASRATIRNFILNKADPPYAQALHVLVNAPASLASSDEEMVHDAEARLKALRDLCREYGVEFVLLVPPSFDPARSRLLASAATAQQVNVDLPIPTMAREYFMDDDFHLNPQGAAIFTDAIARCLRARLANARTAAHTPPTPASGE